MAKFKFSDIEMGFMLVSSAGYGGNIVPLDRATGEIHYYSEGGLFGSDK